MVLVVLLLPDLSEIRVKRKQLGLSQTGLSKRVGVSQSLIAKIEAGSLVPTYSKAKRIFDFFEQIHEKTMLRAADMMVSPIKSIQGKAKIKEAIKIMEKNAISQLPVLENEKLVGTISENIIVDKMQQAKNLEQFKDLEASQIMEDALPTVTEDAPFSVISALLDHNFAVLVLKHGKIRGIISKSDLLGSLLKKP